MGLFISDDLIYIAANSWTEQLSSEELLGILNPFGDARCQTVNDAPLPLLFAAALCTKASAAFALRVAMVMVWRRSQNLDTRWHWRWVAGWAAAFVLYSIP